MIFLLLSTYYWFSQSATTIAANVETLNPAVGILGRNRNSVRVTMNVRMYGVSNIVKDFSPFTRLAGLGKFQ